ncbi:MAG TPA: dihydroorotate dehydrogenase [Coriobacteriia bacterium]|nr:dihydroorotate dehydrogenase [Coriobacteriia bacterium]
MNSLVELAVDLGGLKMKNPFTVASGTFASGREYADLWAATMDTADCDGLATKLAFNPDKPLSILGALTTKGVSHKSWPGNTGIRITETASGMLNSIGLQNPGVEDFCTKDISWFGSQGVPVIVNVSGHSVDEYRRVVERLEREGAVTAYEINISCPNVDCGGMSFGIDPRAAAEVTQACRALTKRPLIIKLTPNVTDITEIARACEAAGASGLSLINTVAGMAIDIRARKPLFDRKMAGLSGPAIKPIALWAVHRVYGAVKLPILGMGGITNAEDVFEFMLAGATAVAVGSQNFTDPLSVPRLIVEFAELCEREGVKNIDELIGGLE